MIAKIEQLLKEVEALHASNAEELEALRIKYLSKKGAINDLMADFRNVAADQKKEVGMRLNELKNKAQEIAKKAAQKENEKEPAASEEKNVDLVRTFHFSTLDDVISSAKALNQYFTGSNSLYKNRADANYQLVLHQSGCKPDYGRFADSKLCAEFRRRHKSRLIVVLHNISRNRLMAFTHRRIFLVNPGNNIVSVLHLFVSFSPLWFLFLTRKNLLLTF